MDESQLVAKVLNGQNVLLYAALLVFGMTLKRTPFIQDWLIPYVLGIAGMGAGWGLDPTYDGILTGITLAGLSVYGHQLITQWSNRKGVNEPNQEVKPEEKK